MNSAIDISTSGLVAQRIRLDTIAGNLANMSSLRNANGELKPYQARFVVFETDEDITTGSGAAGVKVSSVQTSKVEPNYRFAPQHPLAIKDGKWTGYVARPNVNLTAEMVNALETTRAYEANIGAMEISKNMGQQTLRILV